MAIRCAGLALIVGVVLAFVAPMFMPGYTFINPVDQTDFPVARDALGDSPVLAQWMTFFTLISLLLMSFGFLALYPLASRQTGLGGKLLQFGIIATLIEWSILIIATGMRHSKSTCCSAATYPSKGLCRRRISRPQRWPCTSTSRPSYWHL